MSRHLEPVEPPRRPWFLSTRTEIDEWARERWQTLSALLEAERGAAADDRARDHVQLELGEAA